MPAIAAVEDRGVKRGVGGIGDRNVMGDGHHVAPVLEEADGRHRRRILRGGRPQLQVVRDDHPLVAEVLGHRDRWHRKVPNYDELRTGSDQSPKVG